MPTPASDGDLEGIERRIDRPGTRGHHATLHCRLDVDPDHRGDVLVFQQAGRDHVGRARGVAFLARLQDRNQPHRKGGVGVLDGGEQGPQAGDVDVVPAGMHDAAALGGPLDLRRLGDREGIEFCTQAHRRAGRAQSPEGTRLRDRKPVDPRSRSRHGVASVGFVAAEVRISVNRTP